MELHNNAIGLTYADLESLGLSYYSVEKHIQRAKKKAIGMWSVIRSGRGNECPMLVNYDSLPLSIRELYCEKYGNPKKQIQKNILAEKIQQSPEAMKFYSGFRLPNGDSLQQATVQTYYTNAIIIEAANSLVQTVTAMSKALGNSRSGVWVNISELVNNLNTTQYKHTLPTNERSLKRKCEAYKKDGYTTLIHGGFLNSNSTKVNKTLERLILSIYCLGNKPYASWVCEDYLAFLAGKHEIVDVETGELFDRSNFYDEKRGTYISVSESTCWNYINNPKNNAIVLKNRMSAHDYNHLIKPHHHRHSSEFGLSKISLDDRDLPRKTKSGKRVKAYYAYDVASECLIGASYSMNKDAGLFLGCLRNMFQFINANGYGMPMEMEVEHHLVNTFKDDLMKAGVVFPFVRWCNPGNSQEKRAENFNRLKKYGFEKRYQVGIGRFYNRLKANVTNEERVFDELTQEYVRVGKTYTKEELIADDQMTIAAYNNALHSNQKKYPGMTRLEVLDAHIHPQLAVIDKALLARYIGKEVKTSIHRNQWIQCNYVNYTLPNPNVLTKLEPNNYSVKAYYIPSNDGADEIHIYQKGNFIATCAALETYSESKAEYTDADEQARNAQIDYIDQYNQMVKTGTNDLAKVKLLKDLDAYVNLPITEQAEQIDENQEQQAFYYEDEPDEQLQHANAINSL